MIDRFLGDEAEQRSLRNKLHSISRRLNVVEFDNRGVVETSIEDSKIKQTVVGNRAVLLAFGPSSCFNRLPAFCFDGWQNGGGSSQDAVGPGDLREGIEALWASLMNCPGKPSCYGMAKMSNGLDDFSERHWRGLDPEWTRRKKIKLDFERLRNLVSRTFPNCVSQCNFNGIDTGRAIDIKRLPFVGDPSTVDVFNGRLTSKIPYPYNGYWSENVTVIASAKVRDERDLQCRWAFKKIKLASKTGITSPPVKGFFPTITLYVLTQGVGGRYIVQEVSIICNRERTGVLALQLCYFQLHSLTLRQGSLQGIEYFLNSK